MNTFRIFTHPFFIKYLKYSYNILYYYKSKNNPTINIINHHIFNAYISICTNIKKLLLVKVANF